MRRPFMFSALALLGCAAAAQQPAAAPSAAMGLKPSDVAGVWDEKTMSGPKDSVVAASVITVSADGKTWTMTFTGRKDTIPERVVAMGGDSVVTEAGPFPSAVRAGQTVTVVRSVMHYKGDMAWGTSSAEYSDGAKRSFKTSASRRK